MSLKLSFKSAGLLIALIIVAVLGASSALFYAWQSKRTVDKLVSKNIGDMMVTMELDVSLLQQQNLIASYLLVGDYDRTRRASDVLEPIFRQRLDTLRSLTDPANTYEQNILENIRLTYSQYDLRRDQVFELYRQSETTAALQIYLNDLTALYDRVAGYCDRIVVKNRSDIQDALNQDRSKIHGLAEITAGSIALVLLLGTGLVWVLLQGVFRPLQRIRADVRAFDEGSTGTGDLKSSDLNTLRQYLRALMSEVVQARSNLEDNRRSLIHHQRLAAVGNAIAHIAHEIRGPLATMSGFVRLTQKHADEPERIREYMDYVQAEVARLSGMLTAVMEFSKPVRVQCVPQSLNPIVRETVQAMSQDLPKEVNLEMSLDPGLPEVSVDAGPLKQVIFNLVRNAVEAVGSAGHVRIGTHRDNGGATITVEDDGCGIPAEVQKRIFEPFFTTKGKGNGLGLSICRQIVIEHNGSLEVHSAPGSGTTFVVKLHSS